MTVPPFGTQSSAAAGPTRRTGFHSLRAGGLDWDSVPLRLFAKGNARTWNPADVDLERDAEQWSALPEGRRERVLRLCAQFAAGEEAVTEDILPFIRAMAAEGRVGDEMYLTQFAFEEAKHVQAFRRWLDALGVTEDLHEHVTRNAGYRRLFYQELPEALDALHDDPSPRNQVRASVTYNHIVEGALALTGYHVWNHLCAARGIFPGMQRLVGHVSDDERRHVAWGTFTCRRHVAADESLWQVARERFEELLPHLLATIERYEPSAGGGGAGRLSSAELLRYTEDRARRRLAAIASARGLPAAAVDNDAEPEDLEERFGAEDAAALAR